MTLQMWTATLAKARTAWEEQSEGLNGPRKNLAQADPALLGDAVQGAADAFLTTWEQRTLVLRDLASGHADSLAQTMYDFLAHRPGVRAGHAAAAALGGPRHRARPGGGPVTTIAVPAWLPTEPELKVTEASGAILTDVRAAATAVSDVAEWARANGAPADFSGDAAEAADHAVTRFATDTDAVGAALERGALAIDQFLTQMRQRRTEREELMERRQTLNGDRESLLSRIETATEDQVPGLQAEAAQLRSRFEAYHRDLQTWRDRVDADEQAAVRALGAVDQLAEGLAAAKDSSRADTDALAARAAHARHRHRRGELLVGRALAGRAQRADDQRPRPRRQHQRHPDRRPRRGQHLVRAARHRVPPRPPGVRPGPQRLGAAVAGERPVHRGRRRPGAEHEVGGPRRRRLRDGLPAARLRWRRDRRRGLRRPRHRRPHRGLRARHHAGRHPDRRERRPGAQPLRGDPQQHAVGGPAARGLGLDDRVDRLRLPQLQPRVEDAVGPDRLRRRRRSHRDRGQRRRPAASRCRSSSTASTAPTPAATSPTSR